MADLVIIEDDARIRLSLSDALRDHRHEVRAFDRGFLGLDAIVATPPDLAVVDLGLPDIDGRDLVVELRKVSAIPIIVATARDDEREIVQLLTIGADDYVVKPYGAEQLHARIVAVLRRVAPQGAMTIDCGPLHMDPRRRTAVLDGQTLDLTPREYELLLYLASHVDEVITKQELLAQVWRQPWGGSDKTIDVHISWLRRKLGETAASPRLLHAVRGVGVRFTVSGDG
jgi:two-component system, OmpR family, KDP operon response regulator KdpE